MNNIECRNLIFLICFYKFVKNCVLYFNIFKLCNGKDKCLLGYNDMYYFVEKVVRFCWYSKGSDFDLFRIGVFIECFYCMYFFDLLFCSFFKIFCF